MPTHGVREVRRDLESLWNEPKPPPLSFGWMYIPRKSSIDDAAPGVDCALRLADGRELVGRYVDESANSIRFRPWGASELVIEKVSITGARVLSAHRWAERNAVTRRQSAAR